MKHLTTEQRYVISSTLSKGYTQSGRTKVIGKDKSVVNREIQRNRDKRNGEYKATLAQQKYEQRLRNKSRKIRFTDTVKEYVRGKR